MNKIVVAIDFSDCSVNAFLHALSIAQHCGAGIVLVWVEKTNAEKEKFSAAPLTPSGGPQKALEGMVAKYQPELPNGEITFSIRRGKIYKEVTAEARSINAMLIVVGTHGASGYEEFWMGSNANKIVAASQCPVLTIRGGVNISRPLARIVFPVDNAEETRQKASFVAYIARKHQAEIYVLKLYTSKMKTLRRNVDLYTSQVIRYFEEENTKWRVDQVEVGGNISKATIDYARAVDANMIAIMTEQETTTANIFLGPYAHQTVNHSPFPVLSIHSRETQSGGLGF